MEQQHLAYLSARGLSDEVIAGRGYRSAASKVDMRRLGFRDYQAVAAALLIPLHRPCGELAMWQARPDQPRLTEDGPVKFETPAGFSLHLDVHPSRRCFVGDPAAPLLITEGIVKGDALVAAFPGVCPVSLLGVWGWRGSNSSGGLTALTDWQDVALNGRRVYVVFDSDVMVKPAVRAALGALDEFLVGRHATVVLLFLPADGGKVGVDDWLAGAPRTWDELTRLAGELPPLPTPEPVEDPFEDLPDEPGAAILDDIDAVLRRFVVFRSDHQIHVCALWALLSWAFANFDFTPRLLVTAPSKRAGKTRLLEVLLELAARAAMAANLTASSVFRLIAARTPTLLIDEVDNVFGRDGDEDLRSVLNSGHASSGFVFRTNRETLEVEEFSTFTPVAMAGIGTTVPDTIVDRSVVIRLRRRRRDEKIAKFRRRLVGQELAELRRRMEAWACRHADELEVDGLIAEFPVVDDRSEDIWEPLVTVADVAGGEWPRRAREACTELQKAKELLDEDLQLAVLFAAIDIWEGFGDQFMPAKVLCERGNDGRSPVFAEWNGSTGIRQQQLTRILTGFDVPSVRGWHLGQRVRGFRLADLEEAAQRYKRPSADGIVGDDGAPGEGRSSDVDDNVDNSRRETDPPRRGFAPAVSGDHEPPASEPQTNGRTARMTRQPKGGGVSESELSTKPSTGSSSTDEAGVIAPEWAGALIGPPPPWRRYADEMPAEEVLALWSQAISDNGDDATVDYGYEGDRHWFAIKSDGGS